MAGKSEFVWYLHVRKPDKYTCTPTVAGAYHVGAGKERKSFFPDRCKRKRKKKTMEKKRKKKDGAEDEGIKLPPRLPFFPQVFLPVSLHHQLDTRKGILRILVSAEGLTAVMCSFSFFFFFFFFFSVSLRGV